MEQISNLITTPIRKQDAPKSQWSDLVGRFTNEYNKGTTRKITEKRMAMLLATIKTMEGLPYLEYFFNECKQKDNFGKWFNYKTSIKNEK